MSKGGTAEIKLAAIERRARDFIICALTFVSQRRIAA